MTRVMSLGISSKVAPTASRAAILAMGNPVALLARALERETRGFISMTTIRPSAGFMANWTLEPPVSTPTARSTSRDMSRSRWYSRSVRVWMGATVTESPVWTPMGSRFSIPHTMTALSLRSRMTSSSNSFQPVRSSSMSTVRTGLSRSASRVMAVSSASVSARPPPAPPRVKDGRRMTG